MAHFAKLNSSGVVIDVLVIADSDCLDADMRREFLRNRKYTTGMKMPIKLIIRLVGYCESRINLQQPLDNFL